MPLLQRLLRAALGACVGTAFGLVALAAAPSAVLAAGGAAGDTLREPTELASTGGTLSASLTMAKGAATVAGKRVSGLLLYNGVYPGPTLRVSPGDRIALRISDRLGRPTNMHFHGFAVTPSGIGDNVLRTFAPGSVSDVVVDLPADHAQGLYWYHPHLMGLTNTQVYGGLFGLISVGDPLARFPALRGIRQRLLALSSIQTDGGRLRPHGRASTVAAPVLVNGQARPTLTIHPGETQFWRFANTSSGNWYKLRLAGAAFTVLVQDGNTLHRPWRTGTLLLPPGKRFEVLVTGGRAGTTSLQAVPFDQGRDHYGFRTVLRLVSGGERRATPVVPAVLGPVENLRVEPVAIRRTLTFTIRTEPTLQFLIDGKAYAMSAVPIAAPLGELEEWTLLNRSGEAHPFHMHTNDIEVVAVNGRPVPIRSYQDVVMIPVRGSVTIRFRPGRFTGVAVFHCHILFHEDLGMMGAVRWTQPG